MSASSTQSQPRKQPAIPPWATLASGATSGLASCVLLQPMDLLKTRLQQADVAASSPSSRSRLARAVRTVVGTESVAGLWRGTTPTILRNVPGVALYFWSVTELRNAIARSRAPLLSPLRGSDPVAATAVASIASASSSSSGGSRSTLPKLGTAGNLVSGAVARVTVGFILCPVTVIKTRYESSYFSKDAYPSILGSFRSIYRTSGIRGLYAGFTATALRDAPYAGIYLALYEGFKGVLGRAKDRAEAAALARGLEGGGQSTRGPAGQADWLVTSSSGLLAGTLATVITHPFDVLKTRIQIRDDSAAATAARASSASTSRSARSTPSAAALIKQPGILETARAVGLRGLLFDGLGLRCLRKGLSGAIGWTVFEAGRALWVQYNVDVGP